MSPRVTLHHLGGRRAPHLVLSHFALLCVLGAIQFQAGEATRCYLGVISQRVAAEGTGAPDTECPPELYGSDAACAYSCARDINTKQDVCSFMCLPARQCRETYIHPDSPASPGLLLPGCPQHENYEPVQSSFLECVARCCEGDLCNLNGAIGTRTKSWLRLLVLLAPGFLLLAVLHL